MSDWKLYNFVARLIKEELDIEKEIYLNTDDIEIELDGYEVIYYIPVEYGDNKPHKNIIVRFIIYPDFTYNIKIY